MSLRDQLKDLLPEILPDSPSESIKGTELIRLVKFRLNQDYSDATLRYHFSIMCCDPSSPIAKVEQGQGYYLRTHTVNSYSQNGFITPTQPSLDTNLFEQAPGALDLAINRARKFRAVYQRYCASNGRIPYPFEHSFSDGAPFHNVWKFPDLSLVEWHVDEEDEDGEITIDREAANIRAAMALPIFTVSTVKLKMEVTYESFREDFFQALSHSAWANSGEMVIATTIDDEQLADDLRDLGATHGIGVTTLGLKSEIIDALPDAGSIKKLRDREFDAVIAKLDIKKLNPARRHTSFDWASLEKAAGENADAKRLLSSISNTIKSGLISR